jgi:hypothetical protein
MIPRESCAFAAAATTCILIPSEYFSASEPPRRRGVWARRCGQEETVPGIYQNDNGDVLARGRTMGSDEPPGTALVELPIWMWEEALRRFVAGTLKNNPVTEADEPFVRGSSGG